MSHQLTQQLTQQLPGGYEALEPFVDFWSVAGTAARDRRRGESTPEQREAFYAAAKDIVGQALAELDAKPLGELDASEERLMNLMLSFAHVTLAVEMMGDAEARHATFRAVMPFTRSPAGL
jgi:hypothetical protein